jgi:hypothetical protein
MPKDASIDTPDHRSQIPLGAFGIDDGALSTGFSEDLENIDPEFMFQTSDKLDELGKLDDLDDLDDSPTDRNIAQSIAEIEDDAVPGDLGTDDTFANTLGDAMSLLEREYEDEFTASQVLEGTAIRESLDGRDFDLSPEGNTPDDDSALEDTQQNKSRNKWGAG